LYFCCCRGKFRSKPWQQLLDEAKYLVESGVKELNLIAEDTNQYGQDRKDGKGLAQLMHELGKLDGLQWMRILYAYPSYFTEDLIDEIATNPKVEQWIGQITASHADFRILLYSC
jgi:ribosomal protein S12 methylthiotransferase